MKKESAISGQGTIAAIITPPGEGGIGAIRIAGRLSFKIIENIFRAADKTSSPTTVFHLYYGHIVDRNTDIIDEVTMVRMPKGRSYTGFDQVEIFCHGGHFVLGRILSEILSYSARPAEPGEFTRLAFLNGRIDLARAEAVAELIASKTDYSYKAARNNLFGQFTETIDRIRSSAVALLAEIEAAIDFPDEALEIADRSRLMDQTTELIEKTSSLGESYRAGKIIREGYSIAIAGRTNAGKSSLFNLLLKHQRALVATRPGTTRDYLTEWIDLDGIAVSITDTAGLRGRASEVEKAGQESTLKIARASHLILWMVDISRRFWKSELVADLDNLPSNKDIIVVLNKSDKLSEPDKLNKKTGIDLPDETLTVILSCTTRAGFNRLKKAISNHISENLPDLTDQLVVTSKRQQEKLLKAAKNLKRVKSGLKRSVLIELVAHDMRLVINEIDEITGRIYNEEILDNIFSRFCVGK